MLSVPHQYAPAVLRQLLTRRPSLAAAGQALRPDRAERCWTKISEDEFHDAWIIAWGTDAGLGAHDHDLSHAVVHVLTGSLVERYRGVGHHSPWRVRTLGADSSIAVPSGRIHEVHNPYRETALSVHVYSPKLRVMNTHDTELVGVGA